MQYHVVRDGQQLGKVSEVDLKRGLGDGHYLATDLVWRDGMAEWTPLGEVMGLPAQPASPSPAVAGATPAPAPAPAAAAESRGPAAPFAPTPRFGSRTALPMGVAPPNSGLAVTSLVSGIVAILLCGLGGIATLVAIITGHVSLSRINSSGGTVGGRGMAVTGLVMGYVSIITTLVGIAILASLAMPMFSKIQERGNITLQISHARQLQVACQIYAADHEGKYPASLEELVEKGILEADFLKKASEFKVPGWEGEPGFEYLGAGKDDSISPNTPILVSNAADRRGKRVIARADGSAAWEEPKH